jgi:hypothetical protein
MAEGAQGMRAIAPAAEVGRLTHSPAAAAQRRLRSNAAAIEQRRSRGLGLAMALLVVVGAAQGLWAGPFGEVPAGNWAYSACRRLVAAGWLAPEPATGFSGKPQLTRFEFGMALLPVLTEVDRGVAALSPAEGSDPRAVLTVTLRALRADPRVSENEIAGCAGDLRRLGTEFSDVLRDLGLDAGQAMRGLRTLEAAGVRRWRADVLSTVGQVSNPPYPTEGLGSDTVRLPIGHGALALTYGRDLRPPSLLDLLAVSAAGESGAAGGSGLGEPALRDPLVSRLRTAYEYGLGSALSLSLAYEEIARRGQGLAPLDSASVASLGLGYRLSRSASVKLSYSLQKYSNRVLDSPPVRVGVAETAVSIGF